MDSVFQIDLILESITANLSFADLISCSCINKKWNYFCRKKLYDSKKCSATIKDLSCEYNFTTTCQQMKSFDNLLHNSVNIPFNGLIVEMDNYSVEGGDANAFHNCIIVDNKNFRKFFTSIWTKLNLKYLTVVNDYKCIAGEFLKLYLQEKSSSVIYLDVKSLQRRRVFSRENQIVEPRERKFSLENLEVLNVHKNMEEELLLDILQSSPKIQKLTGKIHVGEAAVILKTGHAKKIQEFYFMHNETFSPGFGMVVKSIEPEICQQLMQESPGFVTLTAKFERFNTGISLELYSNFLNNFLISSERTLKFLAIDQLSLIWVATSGDVRPLGNLRGLKVGVVDAIDYDTGEMTLKKINFSHLFPHLETIEFTQYWGVVSSAEGFLPAGFPFNFPLASPHPKVSSVRVTESVMGRFSKLAGCLFPSAVVTNLLSLGLPS